MSHPPLFTTLLNRLSPKPASIIAHLLEYPVVDSPQTLIELLDRYQDRLAQALSSNEFLDLQTAQAIDVCLRDLLERWNQFPSQQQILIGAATRYFVEEEDAESDTRSILGLDDDLEVVNAVLTLINQETI